MLKTGLWLVFRLLLVSGQGGAIAHLWQWTEQHSGDLDPVIAVGAAQQRLQVTASSLAINKNSQARQGILPRRNISYTM
jgi:hypothetical protein